MNLSVLERRSRLIGHILFRMPRCRAVSTVITLPFLGGKVNVGRVELGVRMMPDVHLENTLSPDAMQFIAFKPMPITYCIIGEDGRTLLKLNPDGTVEADLDDTQEAARLFVKYLREAWSKPS